MRTNVAVRRLPHGEDLPLPRYAHSGDSGADLYAAVKEAVVIPSDGWAVIPTGIAIQIQDEGMEAQVRPRSGLAAKYGITVLNTPGTVDNGYRGEIGVILINKGPIPFLVERGMKVAQLVIAPVVMATFYEADLEETARGVAAYGSTGI